MGFLDAMGGAGCNGGSAENKCQETMMFLSSTVKAKKNSATKVEIWLVMWYEND